ncbi:serine/arginine-rich splicing factor SR45a-like [Salvia divinorum]|uniref:Serine/arginine-rich splicing factor SR45a-like n=1 Tax=Salvia divinorum TaxID=28513 RepID=A0ABD1IAQ3_SALDI
MSYSSRSSYRSPSPYYKCRSSSVSRPLTPSRNRSRSYDSNLEKHFPTEGKIEEVHIVVDPQTRESHGFGFVTMPSLKEAELCIKYLDRSVLEGRVYICGEEKARRQRGRTPNPGRYLGLKTVHECRCSPSDSSYSRSRLPRYSSDKNRSCSRYQSISPPMYRRSYSSSVSRLFHGEAIPGVPVHLRLPQVSSRSV